MAASGTSSHPIVLVLGTRNRKKCGEMEALISPSWQPSRLLERLDIRSALDFAAVCDVVENADTFAGNARKKASELALALSHWVIADDSGLSVDALGGAPGVFSARFAGEPSDDDANNRKLLEALIDTPDDRRGAAFRCAWRWLTRREKSGSNPKVPAEVESPASHVDDPGSDTIPCS